MILYLSQKTHQLLAGEICSVAGDNGVGKLKAAYYVLPKELDNLLPNDFRKRHYLNPFGEVVGGFQEES